MLYTARMVPCFPPPEVLDSFPKGLWCRPTVLLHGLTKLLSHPLLCFCHSCSCWPSGLSASLTPGVHHSVWGLLLLGAPKTLWPQDTAAASTTEALNIIHSGSISPASTGMLEKLLRRWELKASQTRASPRRSQSPALLVWAHQVCSGVSPANKPNSAPGGDQLTALLLSSPSVQNTQPQIS